MTPEEACQIARAYQAVHAGAKKPAAPDVPASLLERLGAAPRK